MGYQLLERTEFSGTMEQVVTELESRFSTSLMDHVERLNITKRLNYNCSSGLARIFSNHERNSNMRYFSSDSPDRLPYFLQTIIQNVIGPAQEE